MAWCWSKKATPQVQGRATTEAERARMRAEAALEDTRNRRQEVDAIRRRLASEMARNHFAEAITATFRGER